MKPSKPEVVAFLRTPEGSKPLTFEEYQLASFLIDHVKRTGPVEETDIRRYLKDNPDKVLFWIALAGAFLLGWALG